MANVTADPKRPYKAYAAGFLAFLGLLWANLQGTPDWGTLGVQDWLTILIPTILTFGATYVVANPLVPGAGPDELGATNIFYALGVGLLLLAVILFLLTVFKVAVFSWVALVILAVVGVVLLLISGRNGRAVL
jgi:hypothetical protein